MFRATHCPITEVQDAARNVVSLRLADPTGRVAALPGQFVMVGDIEGGERPLSVSDCWVGGFEVTVKAVGDFTRRLCGRGPGDILSVRGAYGSFFSVPAGPERVLIVAGGCAAPPLFFLCRALIAAGAWVTVVNGARTRADLVFGRRFSAVAGDYRETVDEEGMTAVDGAAAVLSAAGPFDRVYASGPEPMLAALREILAAASDQGGRPIPYQFLMERYTKCGIGICGSCVCDPTGLRLCVEGPVLGRAELEGLRDFGVYRRDAAGRRVLFSTACSIGGAE